MPWNIIFECTEPRTQKDYLQYFMTIVSKNQDQTIRRVDGFDLIRQITGF